VLACERKQEERCWLVRGSKIAICKKKGAAVLA